MASVQLKKKWITMPLLLPWAQSLMRRFCLLFANTSKSQMCLLFSIPIGQQTGAPSFFFCALNMASVFFCNSLMDQAVDVLVNWVKGQAVPGLSVEVVRLEGRTPLIFLEAAATYVFFFFFFCGFKNIIIARRVRQQCSCTDIWTSNHRLMDGKRGWVLTFRL